MKIFKQLSIILLIYFVSEVIVKMLGVSFPGSILGMIILLACLKFKVVKLEQIEDVSAFFLSNMSFFFIPAGVSIMASYRALSSNVWQVLLIVVVTTLLVFGTSAATTQYLIRKKECRKQKQTEA